MTPRHGLTFALFVVLGAALTPVPARAQLPDLSKLAAPAAEKAKDATRPAPTKDNPEAKVATASGPIGIARAVADPALEATLTNLLSQYPGVRDVSVVADNGVVRIEGQVEDDDTRDEVTEFTRRVEGVRLVLNRMKTDAQLMTGTQLAINVVQDLWDKVRRNWLVVIVAVVLVMLFSVFARVFGAYSETLLSPFVRNPMLRSVVGSLIGSGLVIGGVLSALSILGLTHAVLSILGLAGVVGLAVGFAFRDIAENFIASVLLGVRRPFQVGDYVTVAGQSGVVRSLNTRATVLVTLEGNHVRIPNNVVYKEILVNSSASTSFRGSFDVVVPYEASTAAALEAMTKALRELNGTAPEPPARALVEALEPGGVRLRGYYWTPVKGVDWFQLSSDAKLRVKVALQQAGVIASKPAAAPSNGRADAPGAAPDPAAPARAAVAKAEAAANLARDAHASDRADATANGDRLTPVEHALQTAETRVSDEGVNLLGDHERSPN